MWKFHPEHVAQRAQFESLWPNICLDCDPGWGTQLKLHSVCAQYVSHTSPIFDWRGALGPASGTGKCQGHAERPRLGQMCVSVHQYGSSVCLGSFLLGLHFRGCSHRLGTGWTGEHPPEDLFYPLTFGLPHASNNVMPRSVVYIIQNRPPHPCATVITRNKWFRKWH